MPDSNGAPLDLDYIRGPEGIAEIIRVIPGRHDDGTEVCIFLGSPASVVHIRATEFRDGAWDAVDLWGNSFVDDPPALPFDHSRWLLPLGLAVGLGALLFVAFQWR